MHSSNRPASKLIAFLHACDNTRELWHQLNGLRGLFTLTSWLNVDLGHFAERVANVRDAVAMHYAFEWGGNGPLRDAALRKSIPTHKLNQFLDEQMSVYRMICKLASDVDAMRHATDIAPAAIRTAIDQFKMFDTVFIAHESRKAYALNHPQPGSA